MRVIPVEGKGVGEMANFGGLMGYAPIIPVNQTSCEAFVTRGGRIPAPIHSFKTSFSLPYASFAVVALVAEGRGEPAYSIPDTLRAAQTKSLRSETEHAGSPLMLRFTSD